MLALTISVMALPACGGPKREVPAPAAEGAGQPAQGEAGSLAAEAPPDDADSGTEGSIPKPPPLTGLGVPECDGFVLKYVACVDLRVPADQQDRLMRELHTHRVRWLELAKMPAGRVAAGLSCRGVAQRLKGDLIVDYGCEV